MDSRKIMTMKEMIDLELEIPDVSCANPQTLKQVEQWHTSLMKRIEKLFARQSKYMTDNNQSTEALLIFLDKYPELFRDEYGEINRDMIKFALHKNIEKNRELIDKIQEIEKKLQPRNPPRVVEPTNKTAPNPHDQTACHLSRHGDRARKPRRAATAFVMPIHKRANTNPARGKR
jgi:hypothetical protein